MDPEALADLLAAAVIKSGCLQARCRVTADIRKWWVIVIHLDDSHACPFHETGEYPTRFVSIYTLLEQPREVLVGAISNWLSHLHTTNQDPANSTGGDSAPRDADPTPSTASDGSAGRGVGSDAIAWDRVAPGPRD